MPNCLNKFLTSFSISFFLNSLEICFIIFIILIGSTYKVGSG
nr:MAG TPA: hypothetical protein [Caudoviricetes sp.]